MSVTAGSHQERPRSVLPHLPLSPQTLCSLREQRVGSLGGSVGAAGAKPWVQPGALRGEIPSP